MKHAQFSENIALIDPIWSTMRADGKAMCRAEPTLAHLVNANILDHEKFEDALAYRLAAKLAHPDVNEEILFNVFQEVNARNPHVVVAAHADLLATLERDPACHRAVEAFLFYKGYQAIQLHRYAHDLWSSGRRDFALYIQSRSSIVFQVDIHPAAQFGYGIMLDHATGLVVGETSVVGNNVSILHDVTLGGTGKVEEDRHPKIQDGVLIGAGAKILGNITIGRSSRIAAGSVVLKDVDECVSVAGIPAKIIGRGDCPKPAESMDQIVV